MLQEGTPKNLEWSSGGQAPCSTGFLHKMSVLGTHLYWCTSWWCCERLDSVSVNFLEDSFDTLPHFVMGDLQAHLSTPRWAFSSSWPKMAWPLCPPIPIHPKSYPKMKKSPQREIFCWWGRGETKTSRSKRYQNQRVQKVLWAVAKSLNRCTAWRGEYFDFD